MDGDARSFRVALVSSELVNPPSGGFDALTVLQEEDWGVVQLPASDYPDDVAALLLEQVAEQTEEFSRHGYRLAIIGNRVGLDEALARRGIPLPPQLDPASAHQLKAFLSADRD